MNCAASSLGASDVIATYLVLVTVEPMQRCACADIIQNHDAFLVPEGNKE
jgi:hypothetical protein